MASCLPFRARQGIIMLHLGHRGWERFPSSKIITVSWTCRWEKCTCITVLVAACPIHPSTGKFHGTPMVRKSILYVCGSSPGFVASQRRTPPLPSHDVSACVLPENRAPSPHYTPCTESDSSDSPGTKIPIPSSFSHALPPAVSPSPVTGVRPLLLSYRR